MSTPAIVVDGVSKKFRLYRDRAGSLKEMITNRNFGRFDEFWALRDVSFEVEPGSVYGLVGHNGSGKSSMLRLIAGIQRPTSGRITTEGRISALLELGAGFHPDLSGRENIYLNAAILGIKRREIDRIIDDIIDFSGLSEFIDSPVRHYSSGMYVRLGFAVAVNVKPQILIVDEVIAVGDEEFQRRCFEHLHTLRGQGVTILFVSHSLGLVRGMCDRAAWLEHGVLRAEGRAGDVVNAYLAEVNDAEAARLEEADAEAAKVAASVRRVVDEGATEDAERSGDGLGSPSGRAVTLGEVEFLDASGNAVSAVRSHGPVTVRMHYRVHEPIEHPHFSFSLENEGSVWVANPGMMRGERPKTVIDEDGWVDYHLDRLPLAAGLYRVSVAIHVGGTPVCLDKLTHVRTLRIQPDERPVAGIVDLWGTWSTSVGTSEAEVAARRADAGTTGTPVDAPGAPDVGATS